MSTLIKKILILFLKIMPLNSDIVLESHPDFSDSTNAFYEYLLKQGVNERVKIHWALHENTKYPEKLPDNVDCFYLKSTGFSELWKRMKILYRSRFILDSNSYIKKRRKGQVRFHLGHGMLIKITPGYHGIDRLGEVDGYLITGSYWEKVFAGKLGIKKECLKPFGLPRDDVMGESSEKTNAFGDYVLSLPTFRQHKNDKSKQMEVKYPFGMPEVQTIDELKELNQILSEQGLTMLYRPHPVQDVSEFEKQSFSSIVLANDEFLQKNNINLYELMTGAKAMITDYSSVYFDFLLTGKPIALTLGDCKEYFSSYQCAFEDFENEVKGYQVRSFEELCQFIEKLSEEGFLKKEMQEMKNQFHDNEDFAACERLYFYLKDQYGFGE